MGIRGRLFVALVVAAVVPLVGVFVLTGILLPYSVNASESRRLDQVAEAGSTLLRRDCAALGQQAEVVVAQLLGEIAASDVATDPRVVLRREAQQVVDGLVSSSDPWSVVVVERGENGPSRVAASSGDPGVPAAAADPGPYLSLACSQGVLSSDEAGPVLASTLDVDLGTSAEPVATVLVVQPLDREAVDRLAGTVGLSRTALVLLERTGGVVAASSTLQDTAGAVATEVEAQGGERGLVADRRFEVGPEVFDGRLQVVAVGLPQSSISRPLVISFVVSAFLVALLVWLLSTTVLRPLTELADLARRVAAGEVAGPTDVPRVTTDSDLQRVSSVLGALAQDLRRREADAQRQQGVFLDAFSRFGDALQQTHDRDGLLQTVLQAALLAAEAPMGVALHHDRGSRLGRRLVSLRERARGEAGAGPTELDEALRTRLVRHADRAMAERATIEDPGDDLLGPVLAVPLGNGTRPLGAVVVARDPGSPAYDAVAFEALGALAGNAGTALANIKDHLEVERLSVTDPLTGVHNFRHLSTMLARELERAVRFGHPLGVLMLDIDRFKPVNDTYGHAAGDAVLRELARRVAECVREVDTVARYGGEEFALLLPETDLEGSAALAERILASLRAEPFRLPDGGPELLVTASVGIACYPEHGTTGTDLMRAADVALYEAKERGRDRTQVAALPGAGDSGGAVRAAARD
ncbi:GGDEF domain-containing protein [Aquipuribacter sp. SD81]|uniref:GGDEF domain-containing protein n=1 Tax=Aquipuribacter sp. SD81 TaxID=3127703 RepID=UPI0030190487